MYIKSLVADKFWILESDTGAKIGTVQANDEGVCVYVNNETQTFPNFEAAQKEMGFSETKAEVVEEENWESNGFPTNSQPYNEMYDAQHKLSLFTKKPKSRSYHAAGFFVIEYDSQFSQALCPRLTTLKKYPYEGPFKHRAEMMERLRKMVYDKNYGNP